MVHTPCLVQRGEYVTANNLIANEAEISEQLMVVGFAIGKTTFFVVAVSQKWLLAFGTHKMLNMPMLAQGSDNAFLNGTSARPTDWDAHTIMAAQAVQLVHIIRSVTGTIFNLSS